MRVSRRTVLCLDNSFFVLVDDFEPAYEANWTWHLHSAKEMQVDMSGRRAVLQYDKAALDVVFCHEMELQFRPWQGFDVMPFGYDSEADLPENIARYHLDVSSAMPQEQDRLLTVLFPRLVEAEAPEITPLLEGQGEGVHVVANGKSYRVFIRKGEGGITMEGCESDGEIAVIFEENGVVTRAAVVGGNQVVVDGEAVPAEGLTVVG